MSDDVPYRLVTKDKPTFYFIGVTTGQSSIMQIFPLWMEKLGRSAVVIEGVDLPLHANPDAYRQAVAQIKFDAQSLGGLVTSHKIDLFAAAQPMFDSLDTYAARCHEVSCIAKQQGKLRGSAKDPLTAGRTLETMLEPNYFQQTGGQVLCLGAGGAAVAIALYLQNSATLRPDRLVVVDIDQSRLDHLRGVVENGPSPMGVEYRLHAEPVQNDELLAHLPDGSLIINATGMGKDRPGSPITDAAQFPKQAVAWELNYRGELTFMRQALTQSHTRQLTIHDGWLYFLHGWTQVIAEVLHLEIDETMFESLAAIAASVR